MRYFVTYRKLPQNYRKKQNAVNLPKNGFTGIQGNRKKGVYIIDIHTPLFAVTPNICRNPQS